VPAVRVARRFRRLEETMKMRVWVDQNAALLEGLDVYGPVEIEFDPSELEADLRKELARSAREQSSIYLVNYKAYGTGPRMRKAVEELPPVARADMETAKCLLRRRAEILRGIEEKERGISLEKLRKAVAELEEFDFGDREPGDPERQYHVRELGAGELDSLRGSDPEWVERFEAARERAKAEYASRRKEWEASEKERKAERHRIEAERTRIEEERAAARERALADFVEKRGDENMRERLAAGVLPKREIVDRMFAEVVEALEKSFGIVEPPDESCWECREEDGFDEIEFVRSAEVDFESWERVKALESVVWNLGFRCEVFAGAFMDSCRYCRARMNVPAFELLASTSDGLVSCTFYAKGAAQ